QHAQDVVLDAIVVGDHVVRQLASRNLRMAVGIQIPEAGTPLVALLNADLLGQVHALEAREAARQLQRLLFGRVSSSQDATVLSPFLAQDASQTTGIDAGDGDGIVFLQVVGQRLLVAPVA